MATDKQTEPLVDNFHPASSMYGISNTDLVDLNEVCSCTAGAPGATGRGVIPAMSVEQRQAEA